MSSFTYPLSYSHGRGPESPDDVMMSPTPAKSSSMSSLSLSRPSPSSLSSLLVTPKTKLGGKLGGFLTLSADAMSRAKHRKEQKMVTLQDKQRRRANIMDAVDDLALVSFTSGSDLHDIGETAAETYPNPSLESKSKRTRTKGKTSPSSRSNAQRYGRRGSCTAYTVEITNGEEYQPSSFRNLLDHPGSKKNTSKSKQKQSQSQVPSRRSKKSTLQSPATTLPLTIDDRPIPLKQPRPARVSISTSSLPTNMPLGGGGGHNSDTDDDEGSELTANVVTPTTEPRYQRRGAETKYSGAFHGGGGCGSSTNASPLNKPRMS
jgi:hypothetical protein